MARYEPVIGLEVHCQLKTKSKLFSGDPYQFGNEANSAVGPVTLGLPGVLPVLNKEVLTKAIMAGIAMQCKIAPITKFDRKHYFYPDLPKGYQISQYDLPYATNGYLSFKKKGAGEPTRIGITRIHIEEDAGKLIHAQKSGINKSYVDLNRAGVPLIEIVSEPDIRSAEDAYWYLLTLKGILRSINVSNCNMEEGSLRCDANISIRRNADEPFGTRVEIKNLNSFKAVRAALEYEIKKQSEMLDSGEEIKQCTALWDADIRETRIMRIKEDADDYRYFPDPDLTIFRISEKMVANIKSKMPELPDARKERYQNEYNLPEYDSDVLSRENNVSKYFEETVRISKDTKKSSNWVKDEVLGVINKQEIEIESFNVTAKRLGELIRLLNAGEITGKMAKQIFEHMYEEDAGPAEIITKYNYKAVEESSLGEIIDQVIKDNPDPVNKILSGNDRVKGFLVGQVMKATRGQAPPEAVNRIIDERIKKLSSEKK